MPPSEHKRTDQLRPGDAVRNDDVVSTVTHTQPCICNRVLVVFDDATTNQWPADELWTLATDDEIAAARAAAKRLDMARALEHLTDLIRHREVAPTMFSIDVSVVTATIAELQTWAAALGRRIERGGVDGTIPVVHWADAAHFGEVRLELHAQAHEALPAAESTVTEASPARTGQEARAA